MFPLDKDTYDGHEHKYTRLNFKQNHLAISKEEYIDLTQTPVEFMSQITY